ncbi:MAG: hypothetical protein HYZ14_11810 [Bacteroidetes bacterium]|nr:hypothetical protein [Bacteroidota bacterium]
MKKTVLFLVAFLMLACESQVHIQLTCKDAITHKPLEGVAVSVQAGLNGDYTKSTAQGTTDAAGFFETFLMIGCPGKCYDIYITYSKEGYQSKKELNVTDGEVLLEQVKP